MDTDDPFAKPVTDLSIEQRRAAALEFRSWSTTDQAAARILAAGGHWLGDDALFAAAARVIDLSDRPVWIHWYWYSVAKYARRVDAAQGLRDLLRLAAAVGLERRGYLWDDGDEEDQEVLDATGIEDLPLMLARIGATAGTAAVAEVLAALATLASTDPAADLSAPEGRAAAIGHLEADVHAAEAAHDRMEAMIECGLPDIEAFLRLADEADRGVDAAAARMSNFKWEQQLDRSESFVGATAATDAERLWTLTRELHGCRGGGRGLRGRVDHILKLHAGGATADALFDEARARLAETDTVDEEEDSAAHARTEARDEWLSKAGLDDLLAARPRYSGADRQVLEAMIEYRREHPD